MLTTTDCKNILIAEDTRINQKIFQRIVLKCGHNPTIKENGQEALNIFTSEQFDLIITDIMMPIMDGIELIRNVRSLPDDRSNVYIIAASADSSETNRQACLDAGANVFVGKPIDSRSFSDLIHQGLNDQISSLIKHEATFVSHINMSIIEEIAGDDIELLRDITESILIALNKDLASFENDLLAKNSSSIITNVHRIKGNLSQIGEEALRELAVKIEDFAKNQDIESIHKVSRQFSQSLQLVQKSIEDYLASK